MRTAHQMAYEEEVMLQHTKVVFLALACGMVLWTTPALAQGEPDDTAAPATKADLDAMSRRLDALKTQLENTEKKFAEAEKKGASKEELEGLRQELNDLQSKAQELQTWRESMIVRLQEVEQAIAPPTLPEGQYPFDIALSGFFRVGYVAIEDDVEQTDFVGLNDGFTLGNARMTLDASYKALQVRIQFEGAADRRNRLNTASGEVRTQLRDAFIAYKPASFLQVHLGQFKPPFDMEEKRSSSDLLFATRAVENRGVNGVEGLNVDGISVDRQTGIMLSSERLMLEGPDVGFAYFAALTNGTGSNRPLNDNDSLAAYGRLEFYYGDTVTLGAAYSFNDRTTGLPPDLLDERRTSLALDLDIDFFDVVVQAQYAQSTSSFPDLLQEADRSGGGFHAAIGYRLPFGIIPAFRYAFFDPTTKFQSLDPQITQQFDADELTFYTAGVTWDVPQFPVRLQLNYTIAQENDARAIDNNRLDLLGQVIF